MLNQAQELIFERYKHPLFGGEVSDYTHTASGSNPVCGDELTFQLKIDNGIIVGIWHQTRACAVCTAAADLLSEAVINQSMEVLANFAIEEQVEMVGIPLSPIRLKCALLPLETAQQALKI